MAFISILNVPLGVQRRPFRSNIAYNARGPWPTPSSFSCIYTIVTWCSISTISCRCPLPGTLPDIGHAFRHRSLSILQTSYLTVGANFENGRILWHRRNKGVSGLLPAIPSACKPFCFWNAATADRPRSVIIPLLCPCTRESKLHKRLLQ